MKKSKVCNVDDCGSEYYSKGLCRSHYNKIWYEKQRTKPKREKVFVKCKDEDCDKESNCQGWCTKHYYHYVRCANKKSKIRQTKADMSCIVCGTPVHSAKRLYCSLSCKTTYMKFGTTFNPHNLSIWRGEALLCLTRWKWNFVDSLLYFRTLSVYLHIFGYTKEINLVKEQGECMDYCINQIKKIYKLEN